MEHWQTQLPERYAALEDPQEFFTQLGEEAADRYWRCATACSRA